MMISEHPISQRRQCDLLSLNRSSFYCKARPESTENLALMRIMGLEAIYQKPKTSNPHPKHKIYPYLLRHMDITYSNQVWCTDITYIPIRRGFFYLVAVMDWYIVN